MTNHSINKRQIPASGVNLFQLIYILIKEYSERTGKKPMNLSLGNPDGIPPTGLLKLKEQFAGSTDFDAHTYAEDRNLNQFCEGMIRCHTGMDVEKYSETTSTLPIAGIKTATAILPLACGLHLKRNQSPALRVISCRPAYDMIGTWTEYLGGERLPWVLSPENNMVPVLVELKKSLQEKNWDRADLLFTIRPGNPASVRAQEHEWHELIQFCIERKIRLVNDAAYLGLSGTNHTALSKIAVQYPELEWIELYSVSKSFNDPGARLGAAWGSKDFMEDFRLIKGNTDSGPPASLMMAYGEYFKSPTQALKDLKELRELYDKRVHYVRAKLIETGLQPACETNAGFFTLWKTPDEVMGVEVNQNSEQFNRKVISETGIIGVHFPGGIMRYAVCTDVLNPKFQSRFESELNRLNPKYHSSGAPL